MALPLQCEITEAAKTQITKSRDDKQIGVGSEVGGAAAAARQKCVCSLRGTRTNDQKMCLQGEKESAALKMLRHLLYNRILNSV